MPVTNDRRATSCAIVATLAAVLLSGSAFAGNVVFVDDDAPAGGDGLSWDTAFRYLQDALTVAKEGSVDEIRVGPGIQLPDRDEANPGGTLDSAASFRLYSGLALRGGYAGFGAEDPDARDIRMFETVLLGDLLGDDGADYENYGDNTFELVNADGADAHSELDGFTVRAANGQGLGVTLGAPRVTACTFTLCIGSGVVEESGAPSFIRCSFTGNSGNRGGGLVTSGDPVLTDCVFEDNSAREAAAVFSTDGSLVMTGCRFLRNEATSRGPGAVALRSTEAIVDDCLFEGNVSAKGAGAMKNTSGVATFSDCVFRDNSTPFTHGGAAEVDARSTFLQCTFEGNSAPSWGGAVVTFGGNELITFDDCTFTGNVANKGGAIFNFNAQNIRLTRCTFRDNFAQNGGGVFNAEDSASAIRDCTFDGNRAGLEGAGVMNEFCAGEIIGCLFVRNEAARNGGGVVNTFYAESSIRGSRFDANIAIEGGGIFNAVGSEPEIKGCTFETNHAVKGAGVANRDAQPSITDSTFIGNAASGWGGGIANTSADPTIDRCRFLGNSATAFGGGLYNVGSSRPVVTNSTFTGNTAAEGGAIRNYASLASIVNCTLSLNTADFGAALSSYGASDVAFENCVVWNNGDEPIDAAGVVSFSYCDVEGGHAGPGNIDADPLFIDALGADGVAGTLDDDLRLAAGSPAIDAGDAFALPPDIILDLAGSPRFVDDPDTPDTGTGEPEYLDLGAYELGTGCAADIDGDGAVGFSEVIAILAAWGACPGCPQDIDGDGDVGFAEIVTVLAEWGPCP